VVITSGVDRGGGREWGSRHLQQNPKGLKIGGEEKYFK